ncbi:WD40 repeat-like protein [Myriangium duriaei CBS 260.36]|uniref:WD40 repeat-like protein n=1 Tax=Myriangium duriaei CBS 260.36 TaxID=1168546 RepID=A0A9P4JA68_9PEZI|nr:WD40 repeat-like protein [Myriangium duriaei CBS 260.36]
MAPVSQHIGDIWAYNARLQVGHFETIYQNAADPLERLPVVSQAAFNAFDRQHEPLCLEGTRVQVLKTITTWVETSDQTCIFWLNGAAGTGKSTISRTICKDFHDRGWLGASFFFSRNHDDASIARRFFTTLAKQLATRRSGLLKSNIVESIHALENNEGASLHDQWDVLISGPIRSCGGGTADQQPIVLVVDALDECDDKFSVKTIVSLFAESIKIRNVRLRIIITSRPNPELMSKLDESGSVVNHHGLVLHDVRRESIDADIRKYVLHQLSKLKTPGDLQQGDWPRMREIDQLVDLCAGLFIYASTVCSWIAKEQALLPQDSLKLILSAGQNYVRSSAATPLESVEALDCLYIQILRQAIGNGSIAARQRITECISKILGWAVAMRAPMSLGALACLVGRPVKSLRRWLRGLHAVVRVPSSDDDVLQFYHPSFREFLLDKSRCKSAPFCIDLDRAHEDLARHSLELLSSPGVLHQDMCSVRLPGTLRTEVPSVHNHISQEVQYACINWASHTVMGKAQLQKNGKESRFLRTKLLYWIETLAWVERLPECLSQIDVLLLASDSTVSRKLNAFLIDANHFLRRNYFTIDLAPLQIYVSAIVFAPRQSMIRKIFSNHLPRWLETPPIFREQWSSRILQFDTGHSGPINGLCFAPDDRKLVSACGGGGLKIWDSNKGDLIKQLLGHSSAINDVRFTPSGRMVISASDDGTARVWNAISGQLIHQFTGHKDSVNAACFSPDEQRIATASEDGSARVWDIRGRPIRVLQCGSGRRIHTICFSKNTTAIASVTDGAKGRLIDVFTGNVLRKTRGKGGELISSNGNAYTWRPGSSSSSDTRIRYLRSERSDIKVPCRWERTHRLGCLSLDGKKIALTQAYGEDNAMAQESVEIYDLKRGTQTSELSGTITSISQLCFSSDCCFLATAYGSTIRIWDVVSANVMNSRPFQRDGSLSRLHSSPNSQFLIEQDGSEMSLWDAREGQLVDSLGYTISCMCFLLDGQSIATADHEGTVRISDARTGKVKKNFQSPYTLRSMCFSPAWKRALLISTYGEMGIWNLKDRLLTKLPSLDGSIAACFSPDGQSIAVGTARCSIIFFDAQSGRETQILNACDPQTDAGTRYRLRSSTISKLWFSDNGKRLVAMTNYKDSDLRLIIWDIPLGKGIDAFPVAGQVRNVHFSADCAILAIVSETGTVMFRDVKNGRETLGYSLLQSPGNSNKMEVFSDPDSETPGKLKIFNPNRVQRFSIDGPWLQGDGFNLLYFPSPIRDGVIKVLNDTVAIKGTDGALNFLAAASPSSSSSDKQSPYEKWFYRKFPELCPVDHEALAPPKIVHVDEETDSGYEFELQVRNKRTVVSLDSTRA